MENSFNYRRNNNVEFLGCFGVNIIDITFVLHAKIIGAMNAIETTSEKGRNHFWLESNSKLINFSILDTIKEHMTQLIV